MGYPRNWKWIARLRVLGALLYGFALDAFAAALRPRHRVPSFDLPGRFPRRAGSFRFSPAATVEAHE
jgi:hypothetical protein